MVRSTENLDTPKSQGPNTSTLPSISLPKGGGAIKGMGEKFAANPVTGTGSMTVPIATSPGRSGFGPQLSLSYDSGSGNGPFGFGWSLSLPAITRKTDKGLPKYEDASQSDVFILSGAEDLVPVYKKDKDGNWILAQEEHNGYMVRRYRPRIEGLFARIERWTNDTGDTHWRSISRDNILTVYGRDVESRIYDPADPSRIFSWLICESYDDKGNAIVYEYVAENDKNLDLSQANERNRVRTANRYLKRIKYGNREPLLLDITKPSFRKPHMELTDFSKAGWMFEVVFDYGEGHYKELPLDNTLSEAAQHRFVQASESDGGLEWPSRPDPFSTYRSCFEVRTYRRCQRVLMFHLFTELGSEPCLVRSTEFDYADWNYSQPVDAGTELGHEGSTRFASFIGKVTQSGYVPDETKPVSEVIGKNGKKYKYLTYLKKSLPPLEFEYSKAAIQGEIKNIDPESLENLPSGLDGARYHWVDLDGEGLSGILTEQAEAWFYKPNVGEGKFGPLLKVASKPSLSDLSSGRQKLLDLAGDGQLDIVEFDGPVKGFYERTNNQSWENFVAFKSAPNISWNDPNLRFVDLTGDGHADILMTEDYVLTWYPSLAEAGFGWAAKVCQALDEEKGPRLVFADGTQSIYLADMSGDGLTDLVRIRNKEVCYWPNLGYGRFGAKVTMDMDRHAPSFDSPDQFDHKRIRLADVDGSGVTDIIYLKRDGVHIYFNRSGNSLSSAYPLSNFPQIDNLSAIQVADLFGNGTACLVWSSPLDGDSGRQMRYIDLMGGQKPHLMICSKNNLGAETRVYYTASTKFYLADKTAGKPWATRLPFPVHVVEREETYDRISLNRFVTRYAYHHGYFDGIEREFRGFGMSEQWNTAEIGTAGPIATGREDTNWDTASFVPPVLTRTWIHTGAYFDDGRISKQFEGEYYREGDPSRGEGQLSDDELQAILLRDTILPGGLTAEETREACRSLKGNILRQEIYAEDLKPDGKTPTEEADRPYTVSERNYTIECLQPRGDNKHGVFFVHPRETVDFHYERKLYDTVVAGKTKKRADPRVTHTVTLEVDAFGNVLKSAAIGYGRRMDAPDAELTPKDRENQRLIHITCTENIFTNPVDDQWDAYRTPLTSETSTYELRGPQQEKSGQGLTVLYSFDALLSRINQAGDGKHDVAYEDNDFIKAKEAAADDPGESSKYFRRLIEQVRTLYRKNDLTGFLQLGRLESLALPGETYKLAFTPGLLTKVFKRPRKGQPDDNLLPDPSAVLGSKAEDGGGYVDLDGNGRWWIPSGRAFFSGDPGHTPVQELDFASKHFFLPHRFCDPFGKNTFMAYDGSETNPQRNHNLLLTETRDPLNNTVQVQNNYRVLQPFLVTDPNGNRAQAAFDALGMVVSTAVMGKPGQSKGDIIDNTLVPDLTLAQIQEFAKNPLGEARGLLKTATTRIVYDLDRYKRCGQPPFAATLAREIHSLDTGGNSSPIQISFLYSDGFGRELQTKVQAEQGYAPQRAANVNLPDGDIRPGDLVRDANSKIIEILITKRWVGTGRMVYNNKGKPVKKYEPFFSSTHLYEPEPDMTDTGVTPVLFYDPAERVVATLHPNHTYEKVVFDPWRQESWDVSDTVLQPDPRNDPDVGDFFRRLSAAEYLPTWHELRTNSAYSSAATKEWPDASIREAEKRAAEKAAVHAATKTAAHADSLGRTFLTVAHNKFKYSDTPPADPPVEESHLTRIILDIEGNQREVIDALDRVVMRYDYDMLGNRVHQASMEAGERWMLNDATGKPIHNWDSRKHEFIHKYDDLRRPTETRVKGGDGAAALDNLYEKIIYGENQSLNGKSDNELNLRGKPFLHYDTAGKVRFEEYDFKGNLRKSRRRLATNYKEVVNWTVTDPDSLLEADDFFLETEYDALNRVTQTRTPDQSVTKPTYNEANLLEKVEVRLRGAAAWTTFVENIDYNARGQRELIKYGNEVVTKYQYDSKTFRLIHINTRRPAGLNGLASQLFADAAVVQDLRYTYDPAGNITGIIDNSIEAIHYNGEKVAPEGDYIYDAIYRLISAHGREHIGQTAFDFTPPDNNYGDYPFAGTRASPFNPRAVRNYTETYEYYKAGNIKKIAHTAQAGTWHRDYVYGEPSLLEAGKKNNRLTKTQIGNGINSTETYSYADGQGNDVHGCMTGINSMRMIWDFQDQLHQVELGGGGTACYVYDAGGQRVRTVIHRQNGTKQKERIYLGGYEIYREYNGSGTVPGLERETLHIMDDKQRIALVETKTKDASVPASALPETLVRYQFGNHLGSAVLELDREAKVISYEEYHPYGTSSYQAVRNQAETPKRYRYTGKERDQETGLYYHGARYYASWLGRWISCDPVFLSNQSALYTYASSNPITHSDVDGRYDPSAFGKNLETKISSAENALLLEDRNVVTSYWNMGIATTSTVTQGFLSILHVGTGAAQSVEDIERGLSDKGDAWDVAIGYSRYLSDCGEIASAALGVATTTTKLARTAQALGVERKMESVRRSMARIEASAGMSTEFQKKLLKNRTEKLGDLAAEKELKKAGLDSFGDVKLRTNAGKKRSQGIDQAAKGEKPFSERSVFIEAKGRAQIRPNLQKGSGAAGNPQGSHAYNVERLTTASTAGTGNPTAANALNHLNHVGVTNQESFLVAAQTGESGGVFVYKLSADASSSTLVSGLGSELPAVGGAAAASQVGHDMVHYTVGQEQGVDLTITYPDFTKGGRR